MGRLKIGVLAVLLLSATLRSIDGTVASSPCMIAYDDGAVLQSPDCAAEWVQFFQNSTQNCEFASLQGHRKYQEDRVSCNLGIHIPLIGKDATNEAKVDLLAVFDGHGGIEASEMATQHLLDYFLVHVSARAFKKASNLDNHHDLITSTQRSRGVLLAIDDKYLHDILKEALFGAIREIDRKFSMEAYKKGYSAGSTASVVLLLNNEELLVGNVGDSRVILCAGYAEQLTHDHHPDRDDERARIEVAGGFVLDWDVPRVNGILAVSRAIGDVSLKRYGVIAEPEMVNWRNITAKDRYLVVASDGVFESLTPENVCQLIEDAAVIQENGTPYDSFPSLPSFSLAYRIVKTALERGSTDNLSAIVVPLAKAPGEALVHKMSCDNA
ncbi:hypothetical protein L1987_60313 [Smallanthus sonchifolius]|uniref:Uncharacterized protein n=1 Tax=Smallanthus sonchifolius TaxID=185202 RepID=A0ACB9D7P7_9ASTR|nr:hypothetical protein L1987_60313 [Smallanthus sonchifolius]